MATTKFKDMPVHLSGDFIATGAAAPDFELVKTDLGTLSLSSLKGKRVILNIFPSLDTGVCAMSVRKFNQLAASLPDTEVLGFDGEGSSVRPRAFLHRRGDRKPRSALGFPPFGFR